MALSLVQWDTTTNSFKSGGTAPVFRGGRSSVGAGVTSLTVTFSSELPDANFTVIPAWQNTSGAFPQQQPLIVTAFTTTGFTVTWPAPTDTASYFINWLVMPIG